MVDTCLLPEHIIVGLLSGLFSLFYIFFTVDNFSGTVNKFHLARECFCEWAIVLNPFTDSHSPLEDELVGSSSSHLVAAVGWLLARQRRKVENPGRVYDPKWRWRQRRRQPGIRLRLRRMRREPQVFPKSPQSPVNHRPSPSLLTLQLAREWFPCWMLNEIQHFSRDLPSALPIDYSPRWRVTNRDLPPAKESVQALGATGGAL